MTALNAGAGTHLSGAVSYGEEIGEVVAVVEEAEGDGTEIEIATERRTNVMGEDSWCRRT